MPKISVIIPNYNCSRWLHKVIESCIMQEYLHEIIIVDDYSEDNSWDILQGLKKSYPNLVHIYRNTNKGANYARNLGFEKSSGDYIQWLDADDYLLPGKFKQQIHTFSEYPDTDIVYSDWYMDFYDYKMKFLRRDSKEKSDYKDFTFEILTDNWSMSSSYLLNRLTAEQLHKLQAWNPKRKIAQDREYFTMAAFIGAKFRYSKGYFSVYNFWNENQVSAMNFKQRLEYQLVLELKFRKIITTNNYSDKVKKKYLSVLNAHAMNACYYNPQLTITTPFSFFNIYWQKIHWKKRVLIPFIYAWQHIKYLFKQMF